MTSTDTRHPDSPPPQQHGPSSEPDPLLEPVSRRTATIWNVAFWYAAQILVLARNILLVPVFFTYIGKEEYNAWLVSGFVLTQLTNVDFGVMAVMGQRVASAYGDRQRAKLDRHIGGGLVTLAVLACVVALVTAAISPFIPRFIDVPPETARRLTICFLFVGVTNAIQLMAFAASGLLRALQRPLLPGVFMVLSELAALATTALLVVHGWGLYAIVAGLLARGALEAIGSGTAFCFVALRRLRLRPVFDRGEAVALWRLSSYQFLTQLAGRFKQSLDAFVLGAMLGTQAGGGYALTIRAHESVRMFAAGIVGAAAPSMAHLHGEGRMARLKNVVLALFEMQSLLAAIGFGGVIAFNQAFMQLWVGPDVFSGQLVNVVAALAAISWLWSTAPYEAVFALGGFSAIAKVVWFDVVLRFMLMALLLMWIGVVGTPVASFVCQLLAVLVPLTWLVARSLQITRRELLATGARALRLMLLPLALAAIASFALPPAESWGALVAQALLYLALCGIGTWLLDRELVRLVLRGGRGAGA
jgi:O-antigen/teichoic acid export membrane protein